MGRTCPIRGRWPAGHAKPGGARPSGRSRVFGRCTTQRQTHRCDGRYAFSHPDCTVGSGISPDHARGLPLARGLYRRSGLDRHRTRSHPNPEGCAIWIV